MPAVLELPDELAARIAARPGGREDALAVLSDAFADENEALSEEEIASLRLGAEQSDRGETVSLEETMTYVKARLDERFGLSKK